MNTKSVGWAPANPWFGPGYSLRETRIVEGQKIQLLLFPYYLATKISAFRDRGSKDPRTSHDFEDIVYLLDNRTDLLDQLHDSPPDVKLYLRNEFQSIMKDVSAREAIYSNLVFESRKERFDRIITVLEEFCASRF